MTIWEDPMLRKGIEALITELVIAAIVLGFGTILLSVTPVLKAPPLEDENPLTASGYILKKQGVVILANWGEDNLTIELICISSNGSVSTLEEILKPKSTEPVTFRCAGNISGVVDNNPLPLVELS